MVTRSRARHGRRAGERGATVFIVVLVLTMLTAIGVFAAGAATLSVMASGHERQMTQTRYLTEYAISLVLADLEEKGGLASANSLQAQNTQPCSVITDYCVTYIPRSLQVDATEELLVPSIPSPSPGMPGTPGSLGVANVGWNFKVELTDKYSAITPPAGSNLSTSKSVNVDYYTVVVSARGVILPNPVDPLDTNAVNAAIAAAGSQDALIAYITLPSP